MSWTLGNKKWTIPFKSFNNISCRIDIYKRDYTGSTVTELSTQNALAPGVAAADPIYYEEDDDDNLLTVVRTKTGYINLIETVYGGLSDLYPTKDTDLFVEFYYGSTLNFIGFIQAQSFDNQWKAAPREVSLPIISPLGLLESITMPVYNPPQAISLAALLDDVLDKLGDLGIGYDGVIWPQKTVGLSTTLSSLVTSPFNPDYSAARGQTVDLFAPVSAQEYIEGLCNCFGWIVHETATKIVFSMFDHTGNYNYVTAANLRTLTNVQQITQTGETVELLSDYATPADKDGKESAVLPVDKVVLDFEGGYVKSSSFDFSHLKYYMSTSGSPASVLWLKSYTPELSGGDSPLLDSNSFLNGKLISEGVNPCSCGSSVEQKECILVNLPNPSVALDWLFTVKFYDRPTGNKLKLKWNMRWGDYISELDSDDEVPHKNLGFNIKAGTKWYHGSGVWNETEPQRGIHLIPTYTGNGAYYGIITDVPAGMPIEVRFYQDPQPIVTGRVQTLSVEDLGIEELPILWSDYLVVRTDSITLKNNSGSGQGKATVNMLFNPYREGSNLIGNTPLTTAITTYPYLMASNARLQIRFKKTDILPDWIYIVYMSFMSQSWRIISISEYPWNDEVVITMQRIIY
jgi:hypothetical protein